MRSLTRAVIVVSILILIATSALAESPPRPPSPQKTGQLIGTVDYCGPSGVNGVLVFIYGTSFMAKPTLGSGQFSLYWLPVGSYALTIDFPNAQSASIENVQITDNTITDLGVITICRDVDGDLYTEETDCNDYNENINPEAVEECDGIDNDCDGTVDEECDVCVDDDGDGFYAQEGCLTAVDCDDSDFLINPTATELCDGLDNNCDGFTDEGFDHMTDPANCGSCGMVCSYPNANAHCISGFCSMGDCDFGYGDCDLDPSNGCEADLSSMENCGACGAACLNLPGSYSSCDFGACFYSCDSDLVDCNGDLGDPSGDGCEANLDSDVDNCGSCFEDCGTGVNQTSAFCAAGNCQFICDLNYGDCDPYPGCETFLLDDPENCGSCGEVCDGITGTCVNGWCGP